jgi:hypothetical protein
VISTWMLTAAIVVVILMTPLLLQKLFGLSPRETQMANLVGTAALCLSTVAIGAAADQFGVRRVSIPILLLLHRGCNNARSCGYVYDPDSTPSERQER